MVGTGGGKGGERLKETFFVVYCDGFVDEGWEGGLEEGGDVVGRDGDEFIKINKEDPSVER